MAIIVGGTSGGSPFNQPTLPDAVVDGEYFSTTRFSLAHDGTLIDTVLVPDNASTGTFQGQLRGSAVWSVSIADCVTAGATGADLWAGQICCWHDDTSDRLYIFPYDQTTSPYTFYTLYITLETGALTFVGGQQLTASPFDLNELARVAVKRSAISSGDFTFYTRDETFVIDSADGSEASFTTRPDAFAIPTGNMSATYIADDDEVFIGVFFATSLNVCINSTSVCLRGYFNAEVISKSAGAVELYVIPWGSNVKVISEDTNTYYNKTYTRADFDTWAQDYVTYIGLK